MSFESIWGFNPERESKAQNLYSSEPEPPELAPKESGYSIVEQFAARIPCDVDSQIYELRRLYRL